MKITMYICVFFSLLSIGCSNTAKNYLEDGKSAFLNEQYDSAYASLQSAVKEDSQMEEAHYYLGRLYQAWKKDASFEGKTGYEHAVDAYKKAIELKNDYSLAYQYRGEVYRLQGKLNEALKDYKKAIELSPNSGPIYEALSDVYIQLYEVDKDKKYLVEAEKAVNKAIERDPKRDLYNKRAEINLLDKDYQDAIDDYTKIIEMLNAEIKKFEGKITKKKESEKMKVERASSMLERGKIYFHIAEEHLKNDEGQQAVDMYTKAFGDFNECSKVFQNDEVYNYRKDALQMLNKAKQKK